MREEKKSGLEIVIIFLSLIVTLLVGYIVYDKVFNVSEERVDNTSETKLLDLSQIEDYVNYDGSYPTVKRLIFESETEDIYSLNLGADGRVYINDYAARIYIDNVRNVIDIITFESETGDINGDKCYLLTDTGKVYLYRVSDMINEKYEVELVEDIDNVSRLINYYNATSENTSSSGGVIAITDDGTYVQLDSMNG